MISEIKNKNQDKDKGNLNNIKNEKKKNNEADKSQNKGFYIIISSDNSELILNLVAIINYLRK